MNTPSIGEFLSDFHIRDPRMHDPTNNPLRLLKDTLNLFYYTL